ncbi:MAG: FAD-binding protein [Bacteroidia bacterium]|nr:FAD-binding protein [Bacteroidia bacterium]MBT8277081.1 FAD-binding protein [Bacteroidia bacterium]NNF32068.1 FAD-binding protein [Flavobacteriaceae bacterium]NNK52989.1 FAD-binding protein [Flavobacteriaceae bacterium]NNM07811.1 FAD-binding protein [Flavobacteriaceae bacterium]
MEATLAAFEYRFIGDFYYDDLHKTMYATDASVYRKLPLAVAYPRNEKGIKQLIAFAIQQNTSLIPRTAGTSLAGQCVGEGIIVDVSKYFTEILALDVKNKTVTVQPGVIRDELNEYLKPHGIFFGPNTSTSNRCMIGGMAGNNSSGTTSIKYGVTRDKVLKMKTILSSGEEAIFEPLSKEAFITKSLDPSLEGKIYNLIHAELSSESTKNEIRSEFPKAEIHRRNTGYALDSLLDTDVFSDSSRQINICDLLCGSEGTLAFTTEITLKLDDLPPAETAMIVSQYHNLSDCLNDVLIAMKHELYTCELMDDIILDCTRNNKLYDSYRFFVEGNPRALLLLELRANSKEDLDKKSDLLLGDLESSRRSYSRPVLEGDQIDMALELRKAGLGLLGNMVGDKKAVACIEDTAVALSDLPEYIEEFTALMSSYNQSAVYYAHAGAGELHLRPILNLKKKEGVEYFRKITTDVAKLVKKYRGSFSGEHGDGIVRGEFLPKLIGEKNYELVCKIKQVFDPHSIFNPGKIVDPWSMDTYFRYNADREEPEIETFMDFEDSKGILRLAENCNGSGDCRKTEGSSGMMCPSYHATRDEKDTTRGRANILREVLTNGTGINTFDSKDLKASLDLCVSCKACASECPSNVNIAAVKAEFQYQYNRSNRISLSTKLIARSSKYNRMASRFPKLSNWLFRNRFSSTIIKKIGGIAPERTIPVISIRSFNKLSQLPVYEDVKISKEVCLFVDEFSNYLEAEIALDAFSLLTKLGYKVLIVDHLDSARALISKGFLEEAKKVVDDNINYFKDRISENTPLLGIEPSAILGFRDEYLRLADDKPSAKLISEHTYLIEEFIAAELAAGRINSDQFTTEEKKIKIHSHCHQKALSNQKVTFDILNIPKNYKPTIIASGCCGMAGGFGYEKQHYEISMKIGGLKLFPAINKCDANVIISANGTSCRHQIMDGTQRKALHPVTILNEALLDL